MHTMRVKYAVGKYDTDPLFLAEMQNRVPLKTDGKYFYERLDQPQITELSAGFILGVFNEAEKESVRTKFPDIDWSIYTEESYVAALEEAHVANPTFVQNARKAAQYETAHAAWAKVSEMHQDGIPVGWVMRYIVDMARKMDD